MPAPPTAGQPGSPEGLVKALLAEGVGDRRVLAAFRAVSRARFVPPAGPGGHEQVTAFHKEADRLIADPQVTGACFVPLVGLHGVSNRDPGG